MTPELKELVIARLFATEAAEQPWAFAILAALEGEAALAANLDDEGTRTTPSPARVTAAPGERPEPPGVYVGSLTVEGFRGVGPAVTLSLPPGPGLNLVVGRNGSGKSSFAEGLEVLLTGRNFRWEKRSKVWQDGWRNLHHGERVTLKASLLVEGEGALTATRGWHSEDLAAGSAAVWRPGETARPLDSLGWGSALTTFRPFLSYNELGSLLEDGPSKLYDALSAVLGLEELSGVVGQLGAARKARQELVDDARDEAKSLAAALQQLGALASDERPAAAIKALKWPHWDLAALAALAAGDGADERSALALLRQLQNLRPPDTGAVAAAVSALRAAEKACAAFAGTDAERSREHAGLLAEALRFHDRHAGGDCPVCGSAGTLEGDWRARTAAEIWPPKRRRKLPAARTPGGRWRCRSPAGCRGRRPPWPPAGGSPSSRRRRSGPRRRAARSVTNVSRRWPSRRSPSGSSCACSRTWTSAASFSKARRSAGAPPCG